MRWCTFSTSKSRKSKAKHQLSVVCACARVYACFSQVWLLTVLWAVSRGSSDECGENEEQTRTARADRKTVCAWQRQPDCHTPVRLGKKIAVQSSLRAFFLVAPSSPIVAMAMTMKQCSCEETATAVFVSTVQEEQQRDFWLDSLCVWVSVIRQSVERGRMRDRGREWQNKHSSRG